MTPANRLSLSLMERPSGRPAHLSSPLFRWSEISRRGGEERSPLLQAADTRASAGPSPLLRVPSQRVLPPFPSAAGGKTRQQSERRAVAGSLRSRHRRTRRPPLTRLEQLGSSETWALLLLPLLAATLLLLPAAPLRAVVRRSDCPSDFTCSWNGGSIEVVTRSPLLLLGYVDVRLAVSESARLSNDIGPEALNMASLTYTASAIDGHLPSVELSRGSIPHRFGEPAYPLMRLDPAALLLPQGRVAVRIQVAPDYTQLALDSEGVEVALEYEGSSAVMCRALLMLALCLVSIGLLVVMLSALHSKVSHLKNTSATYKQRSYLECLLPEQVPA